MGKVILVFSAILFSSLFLISQDAYAFTEWYWIDGGATNNWSDTANWECYTPQDGEPLIPCPEPGYPDMLLEHGIYPDMVVIAGDTVTIDVPVIVEPIAEIIIHDSTITSNALLTIQGDGTHTGKLRLTRVTFTNSDTLNNSGEVDFFESSLTNSGSIINSAIGEIIFHGFSTNTWINSATGTADNYGELYIGPPTYVQNSGTITNNVGAQLGNDGEIINECTGQFIGVPPTGKVPKDNCAFSDADNISDAIEELLSGSSTGLTVTTRNDISNVNYSFDADSNIVLEGINSAGDPIATWSLPPGTTSGGTITVRYSTGFFGPSTTITGVDVPYPPGKTLRFLATSPTANQVCIRDLPSGVTQSSPFFGNCFENIAVSRIGLNCPTFPTIEMRTVSGFPDVPNTREYTCQAIDIGPDRFLEVTGLAFSDVGEFTDADNDGIHDACIGLPDIDDDGIPDACEDDPPTPPESPKQIKQAVLEKLVELETDSDDKRTDKRLDKAIKSLQDSLDEKLWIDETHLDSKKGNKVFDKEKKTVKELQKILDKDDSIDVTLVQMAIDDLCGADKILAQTAIDDVNDPNNKKIIDANKKMDKAQSELDKNKCDKAIGNYKDAWKKAQKALMGTYDDDEDDNDENN